MGAQGRERGNGQEGGGTLVDYELWAWSAVLQCHVVAATALNFEDEDQALWNEVTREIRGDGELEELRRRERAYRERKGG